MKKYYRLILLTIIILPYCVSSYCQDVGFSQFYNQPLLRNPALAGIFTGDVRFTASYRNQWQSVTIPYRTFAQSSEIKFPTHIANYDVTATLGLQLMRDVAGTSNFSTTQALPALNLSVRTGENSFVSVAGMAGIMQQRFDPSKLILNDQFIAGANGSFSIRPSSNQAFNNTSVNYFDLSTGVSFSSTINENIDYYLGAGLFHLTQPSVGFFEGNKIILNKKLAFNAGLSAEVSDVADIIFYGDYFGQYDYHFKYTGISTFQAGIMLKRELFVPNDEGKYFTAGLLYRWDDALIPVVQLEMSQFILGASYDININKLATGSQLRGGLEITLSFKDFFNSRKYDTQGVKCPKFGK